MVLDIQRVDISEQVCLNGFVFPLTLSPTSSGTRSIESVCDWLAENKTWLSSCILDHGAVLFRGFPIQSPEELDRFIQALEIKPLPYVGGAAPRNPVFKDIHTTNESPPDQPIPFHHEMAQVPKYPTQLIFYCDREATQGGETPIVQSDVVFNKVNQRFPEFIAELEAKGVIYQRTIPKDDDPTSPIGRGWVNTFQTHDPVRAEKAAQNLNVTLEWLSNGDVKTVSSVLPAIKSYVPRKSGGSPKKVWFNSLIAAYQGWKDSRNDPSQAVLFGDGTPMTEPVIKQIGELMDESAVAFSWKKGDVLWIDNNQVMHSRNPFQGPRRILAYLGENTLTAN